MSKGEIIQVGMCLGVDYVLIVFCYQVDEDGRVCGKCDSCCLCAVGFIVVGVFDVICYF